MKLKAMRDYTLKAGMKKSQQKRTDIANASPLAWLFVFYEDRLHVNPADKISRLL